MKIRAVGHVHVSEREGAHEWPDGRVDDAKWEDCLFASAVEWVRAIGRNIPATHAEAEALRADSGLGPLGGASFDDLSRGLKKRYGITMPPVVAGANSLLSGLQPGAAAIVNGKMGNFPSGHRLRRWDPGFTGGHAVYVERTLDNRLLWCDPLAPSGTQPDVITDSEIKTFMYPSWGAIIGTVVYKEVSDQMSVNYKEELWDVKAGTPFYDAPGGKQISTFSRDATIRTFGAPMNGDKVDWGWRLAIVATSRVTGTMGQFLVWVPRDRLFNPRLYEYPIKPAIASALERARAAATEAVGKAIDAVASEVAK